MFMCSYRSKETVVNKITQASGFRGSPVFSCQCFHCQGPGSVLGRGTKISQALQHGQLIIKSHRSVDGMERCLLLERIGEA